MATMAKRFRAFMSPPDNEWETLEELRQKTRETLNRPYTLPEFKEKDELVGTSSDPFAGIFKPFGNATAEEVSVTVSRKLDRFSWRDVVVPVLMTVLVLGGVLGWQIYQQNRAQAIVSPFPANQNASENKPAAEVVPPGTELEPGGPYTGTGSTQSPSNGNTNLSGSGNGGSGGGSSNPCTQAGVICAPNIGGIDCSAGCTIIAQLPAPLVSPPLGYVDDGSINGPRGPCDKNYPCVVTKKST